MLKTHSDESGASINQFFFWCRRRNRLCSSFLSCSHNQNKAEEGYQDLLPLVNPSVNLFTPPGCLFQGWLWCSAAAQPGNRLHLISCPNSWLLLELCHSCVCTWLSDFFILILISILACWLDICAWLQTYLITESLPGKVGTITLLRDCGINSLAGQAPSASLAVTLASQLLWLHGGAHPHDALMPLGPNKACCKVPHNGAKLLQ